MKSKKWKFEIGNRVIIKFNDADGEDELIGTSQIIQDIDESGYITFNDKHPWLYEEDELELDPIVNTKLYKSLN